MRSRSCRSTKATTAGDDDDGGRGRPEIVFITAYDQYAIEAFEQGVVDYVLKPAERERLQVTVDRIQQAPRRSAAPARRPTGARGMQQLLQKLAAKMNPGAAPHAEAGSRRRSARASR